MSENTSEDLVATSTFIPNQISPQEITSSFQNQSIESKHSRKKITTALLLIAALLVLLSVGIALVFLKQQNPVSLIPSSITPTPTPIPESTPAPSSDWLTYRNDEYGFEFKYPNEWIYKEDQGENFNILLSPEEGFYINPGVVTVTVFSDESSIDLETYINTRVCKPNAEWGSTCTTIVDLLYGTPIPFNGKAVQIHPALAYSDKVLFKVGSMIFEFNVDHGKPYGKNIKVDPEDNKRLLLDIVNSLHYTNNQEVSGMRINVKFKDDVDISNLLNLLPIYLQAQVEDIQPLFNTDVLNKLDHTDEVRRWFRITFKSNTNIEAVISALKSSDDVEVVEKMSVPAPPPSNM